MTLWQHYLDAGPSCLWQYRFCLVANLSFLDLHDFVRYGDKKMLSSS